MRRIIIVLLIFIASGGMAQEKVRFDLFTDRSFYTSGETILFNVLVADADLSRVIKIDLINTQGKIISEVSKTIKNHRSNGFLYLSDSLKTGTYLLCASTKGSSAVTVRELFICNRFIGLSETPTLLQASGILPISEKPTVGVTIEGLNQSFNTREKVAGNIRFSSELLTQIKDSLFIAVAEVILDHTTPTFPMKTNHNANNISETDGIVLEGFAKDLNTGAPFQNGCIMLSIPDSIPWLDYCITGKDGLFSFQLGGYHGKIPAIIQGYDLGKKHPLKISLNHTDSLLSFLPDFEKKSVPAYLQKVAADAMEATTLRKIYNCQELSIQVIQGIKRHRYPFYGVPTEIVYPKLFIDLPDFTEISRELLPGVKFRAFNRIPTLQILNPATLNYFEDPPLVTIDGVPVRDLNAIKDLSSKEIERIEICRNQRFFGNLVFSGVVAIYLVNSDYKRLQESYELIKAELDAVQQGVTLNTPNSQKLNEPDLRKVLLWQPALYPEQTVKFEFATSDVRGNFRLIVRGKTADGSVVFKEQTFEVK